MKYPILYTRAWGYMPKLRKQHFYDVLSKNANVFDEKFFEMVQKRREVAARISSRLFTLQIPIFFFLLFALLPIEANFSVFGVSAATNKNLREVLIITSSIIALLSTLVTVYKANLSSMVEAYAQKKSKGDSDVQSFLEMGYGIRELFVPKPKYNPRKFGL